MVRTRRLPDVMMTAGSIGAVLAGTAIINEDARLLMTKVISADPTEMNALVLRSQALWHDVFRWAAAYRADNGPMVGFAVFALVLTVLMFKT